MKRFSCCRANSKGEFGSYPTGTWLRSPHRSQHYPYVEDETVIWVKVGHLPV